MLKDVTEDFYIGSSVDRWYKHRYVRWHTLSTRDVSEAKRLIDWLFACPKSVHFKVNYCPIDVPKGTSTTIIIIKVAFDSDANGSISQQETDFLKAHLL